MIEAGNVAADRRQKVEDPGRIVFCGDGYEKGTYEVHLGRCGGLGKGIGLVCKHRGSNRWLIYVARSPGQYDLIDHRATRMMAGATLRDRPWDRRAGE